MDTSIEINNTTVPAVGFGTYRTGGYECADAVKTALDVGYRHIDTAMAYENEAVIGRVIENADVDRQDVFLTTKIKGYPEFMEYDGLLEAADGCLERLGTDYVDLLLMHWWYEPAGDMEGVFEAMDRLVDEGKVRNIGVSNFSLEELQRAMRLSDHPIFTNQVEYHPYFDQSQLLQFCRENDILLTAYSPLAEGRVIEDDVLARIGKRYGKSAAQVSIRWLIQQENVITIPKSVNESHIRKNFDVFDFTLSDTEMQRIAETKGPTLYELTKEGGKLTQLRATVGPRLPNSVNRTISTVGSTVSKLVKSLS